MAGALTRERREQLRALYAARYDEAVHRSVRYYAAIMCRELADEEVALIGWAFAEGARFIIMDAALGPRQ